MNKYLDLFARIPRHWLFAGAAIIQLAVIAFMVGDRVRILRTGTEVLLQTRPVDPRDFLRGDYVVLTYEISTLKAGELKDTPVAGENDVVYVKLAPKPDGFFQAVSAHRAPVALAPGEVLIRAHVGSGSLCSGQPRVLCETLRPRYGIESYFVPQGEGRELEKARNDGKISIIAAVAPGGRAAIKRLLLDGKPVYDEPLF
jgi:uncharacterized membrane-anchored protein